MNDHEQNVFHNSRAAGQVSVWPKVIPTYHSCVFIDF